MWVLKTEGPSGNMAQYTLFAGKHEIGRSGPKPESTIGCDGWISFPGGIDKSISRNHASITVKALDDPHVIEKRQYICIRDKSKFGVSIDDVDESYREKISHSTQASQKSVHQIQKDMDVPLTQGCSITVGVNNSRLRLEWEELIVSHSLLNKDQIASLNTSCASIGIQVSKSWSERVKLLVMHQIQMTPKLLLALIDQKDIVTPDFMTAIRNRNELKDLIPDPASCCALYEPIGEEPQQRTRWRHRITGVIQDQEPPVHQMGENYIFRPEFVEGFPDEYKAYVMPNARSKGIGAKLHARATLLANHTLIFLQGDSTNTVRQYKQVCERAKAKVECWEAAQVIAQWKVYAPKVAPTDKKITWHVLVPDCDLHGAVGEAVALLRRAGVIYSTLDNVWKAIVYADVKSISKDETELETLSMSLDGSAYPSTLSIDPSAQASLSLTAGGSTQQSHGTHAVIHAKSEKSQRISSKRQRNDSDEVVKREDVVDLDAIPDSLAKTVASPEVRASKRTRGGGLGVAAHTPAPPAPAPAAAVAAAASDLVSPAVMAKGLDGKGAAAASQLEADQATQASPATTRRQRDTDKLRTTLREGMENKKSRNRAAPQPPHPEKAAADRSPAKLAVEGSVLETRVRRGLGVEQMGSSGDQNGGSSAGEGRSGGGSAAAPVRAPSSRRFQLEDTSDPDGWVSIVSDGPGPRVPALSAGAERQKNAGGSGGGGGGAIVNFKRFCKKSDGTGQALSKGLGGGGKIVTFEVWPKYTLAGSGGGGEAGARGVAGARRKGVGKATSSRRAYSDESGEENY